MSLRNIVIICLIVIAAISIAAIGYVVYAKAGKNIENSCKKARILINITEKTLEKLKQYIQSKNIENKAINKILNKTEQYLNKAREYLTSGKCSIAIRYAIKALHMCKLIYILTHHRVNMRVRAILPIVNKIILHNIYRKIVLISRYVKVNITEIRYRLQKISRICLHRCINSSTLHKGITCLVKCYRYNMKNLSKVMKYYRDIMFTKYILNILRILKKRIEALNITIIRPKIVDGRCVYGKIIIKEGGRVIISRDLPCNITKCNMYLMNISKIIVTRLEKLKRRLIMLSKVIPLVIKNANLIKIIKKGIVDVINVLDSKISYVEKILVKC